MPEKRERMAFRRGGAPEAQTLYMTGQNATTTARQHASGHLIDGSSRFVSRRRRSAACHEQDDRAGDPDRDAGAPVALYLAQRSRRPEDARDLVGGAAAVRQARDAGGAVHLQM